MSSPRAMLSSSYTVIRETRETRSPLPPSLGGPFRRLSGRRMRAMRTCGYFLMLSCGFLFVPGSILLGLGAQDTGSGEDLIRRPGIVLLSIAVAGVAVGTLLCCCVRKHKEKHMAETILMKRHSVYSVASMRSHRSSAVSNQSSNQDQRSDYKSEHHASPPRSRRSSRPSRSPSYSRQSSLDSRQSPPPRPRHSRSPSASYSRKSSMEFRQSPTRSRRASSCSYTRCLNVNPNSKSSRRSSATSVRSSSRSPRTSLITFLQENEARLLAPPRRGSKHKSLPSIELADFSTSDLTQGGSSRRESKDSGSLHGKHIRSMSLSTSLIDKSSNSSFRRASHGSATCKEIFLTVPSQHRRFSR